MKQQEIKNIFISGAISTSFIADSIQKHQSKHTIGGHSIFLGQVRGDEIDGRKIKAIEYTANEEMTLHAMQELRESLFDKYPITCMHVYHSLGIVNTGEICFFVFTSALHRKAAIDCCEEAVEKIKATLPIWGKEFFEDGSHQWKVNS